jgi:hypothetical protein
MTVKALSLRAAVLACLLALSAGLFYIGKGHTLIVDTNAVIIGGREFASADTVSVSIDGGQAEEMSRAERIMLQLVGPAHRVAIEVLSGEDKKVEREFAIPTFLETALLSVPAILADTPPEHWITVFTPPPAQESAVERTVHQAQEDVIELKPEKP